MIYSFFFSFLIFYLNISILEKTRVFLKFRQDSPCDTWHEWGRCIKGSKVNHEASTLKGRLLEYRHCCCGDWVLDLLVGSLLCEWCFSLYKGWSVIRVSGNNLEVVAEKLRRCHGGWYGWWPYNGMKVSVFYFK